MASALSHATGEDATTPDLRHVRVYFDDAGCIDVIAQDYAIEQSSSR
jgi:hypothetical protein